MPISVESIQSVLESVRPKLHADGGDVAFAGMDGDAVKIRLSGACASCALSSLTVKLGIERRLQEEMPDISGVVVVRE
jgi:Fe-S cluster biogenesis protein NfuA